MDSQWVSSPNFGSRNGRIPIAIVDHITSGNYPGCLEWLQNPISQGSANYLVTKTGLIFQLVKDGDKAWANGIVNKPNWSLYDGTNPNNYTISIEHEGQSDDVMPEEQYQATLWLHRDLIAKFNFPIDTDHIIGHYRIDSVNRSECPGSGFPWDRLFKDLKGVDTVKIVVVYFSSDDYSVALIASNKNGGCAMFNRSRGATVHADAMNADKVINIGGPKLGHKNEVYWSGDHAEDTAMIVLNGLKGDY